MLIYINLDIFHFSLLAGERGQQQGKGVVFLTLGAKSEKTYEDFKGRKQGVLTFGVRRFSHISRGSLVGFLTQNLVGFLTLRRFLLYCEK